MRIFFSRRIADVIFGCALTFKTKIKLSKILDRSNHEYVLRTFPDRQYLWSFWKCDQESYWSCSRGNLGWGPQEPKRQLDGVWFPLQAGWPFSEALLNFTLSLQVRVNPPVSFRIHCHLLYHMYDFVPFKFQSHYLVCFSIEKLGKFKHWNSYF